MVLITVYQFTTVSTKEYCSVPKSSIYLTTVYLYITIVNIALNCTICFFTVYKFNIVSTTEYITEYYNLENTNSIDYSLSID